MAVFSVAHFYCSDKTCDGCVCVSTLENYCVSSKKRGSLSFSLLCVLLDGAGRCQLGVLNRGKMCGRFHHTPVVLCCR